MASTSPYQQNDYQGNSSYRPYRLPVNDIFKAISAQNEFWKRGASRVKAAYDNILNLKLTNETNREIRDQFIKDAENELTKLGSMNLADPSAQRQGLNIFTPLLQDEGIVSDDAATRHIDKVNNDALSYRDKDNGKGYSITNHKYALTGADEFKNAQDRFAGKKYLQQRREYEQFYDPSSELGSILKNCKPDKVEKEVIQGFHITKYSEESLSAQKIATCMDSGLSDRARRQLQINGAVAYKNQPEALATMYIPHLQSQRKYLSEQKAAMEGILKNRNNLKNLKPDDLRKIGFSKPEEITPEILKRFDEQLSNHNNRILNIDETISKLNGRDFSPILNENYEQVAGTVFTRDYMNNVGEGFSYNFASNTLKADPAQMMIFQQSQMNARQEDDQQHDVYMMGEKFAHDLVLAQMKKKEEDGILSGLKNQDDILRTTGSLGTDPFSAVTTSDSYEQVTEKRTTIAAQRGEVNQWLYRQIGLPAEYNPNNRGGQWSNEAKQYYDNWKLSAANDPIKQQVIKQYEDKMGFLVSQEDLLRNTQEIVNQKVKPIEDKLRVEIAQIKPIQVGNTVITANDFQDALSGRNPNIKIVMNDPSNPIYKNTRGGQTESVKGYGDSIYVNGQKVATRDRNNIAVKGWIGAPGYSGFFNSVSDKVEKGAREVKAQRNSLMQQETVLQRESYVFPELNDPKKRFKPAIGAAVGLSDNYFDKISVERTDLDGRVIINVASAKSSEKDYDQEEVITKMMGLFGGDNIRINAKGEKDPNGTRVILQNVNILDYVNENSMSSLMKPYIRSMEALVGNGSKSTGYLRGQKSNYRMEVSKGLEGGYTYSIFDQSNPDSPIGIFDSRDAALQRFEFFLGNQQNIQVSTK